MGLLGPVEKPEGTLVESTLAHLAIEARNRLGVVVENVRLDREDGIEGIPIAAEIGNEHFDFAVRDAPANFLDGTGKDAGAAVGLVVAIAAGDDGIAQAE